MTENEPLNEENSPNGQIVPSDVSNAVKPLVNGHHANGATYNTSNGKSNDSAATVSRISTEPPDGGTRAWLVMICGFLCNGVIFGIINVYGVIHALLTNRLTEQGDTEASSKAALVGSLTIGTTFLLSPVAGVLVDKIGLRWTTFTGGVLSAGGLLLSSFWAHNITALYLTYGVIFGFGAALTYTPSIAILGHYFKRYLGKVSGFVTAGSSVFTVILPPLMDYLLKGHGLEVTLRVMSLIACFIIVCSLVFKPLHPPSLEPSQRTERSRASRAMRSVVNVDIWKRKEYVIWTLCVPLALFGYFVPYVHMMKFVENVFPGKSENLPVMCIGVTSGFGRLIFGAIADLPGVNRIYLQQLSLYFIGVVTLLLPLTSSYWVLLVLSLIMGLFDGCFITLLGPIAYELCGHSGAAQAIGFMLGFSSIPLTVGPPIAGRIYDATGSYTIPFILAGIPPIVGASLMFMMRCVRRDKALENGSASKNTHIEEGHDDLDSSAATLEKANWNKSEPKPNVALMNGVGTTTLNDDIHRLESNGKARLADTESLTDAPRQTTAGSVHLVDH